MSNSAWQWVVEAKHQFHWFLLSVLPDNKGWEGGCQVNVYMCMLGRKKRSGTDIAGAPKEIFGGFESCTVKAKKGLFFIGNLEQFD